MDGLLVKGCEKNIDERHMEWFWQGGGTVNASFGVSIQVRLAHIFSSFLLCQMRGEGNWFGLNDL